MWKSTHEIKKTKTSCNTFLVIHPEVKDFRLWTDQQNFRNILGWTPGCVLFPETQPGVVDQHWKDTTVQELLPNIKSASREKLNLNLIETRDKKNHIKLLTLMPKKINIKKKNTFSLFQSVIGIWKCLVRWTWYYGTLVVASKEKGFEFVVF